jgi:hypothetical protein
MNELSEERTPQKFIITVLMIAISLAIVVPTYAYLYHIKDNPERCGHLCHWLIDSGPKAAIDTLHQMLDEVRKLPEKVPEHPPKHLPKKL